MSLALLSSLVLTITVWFNGVPVACVVDTGSLDTILTRSAAARIGTLAPVIARTSQFRVQGVGGASSVGDLRSASNVGTAHLGWAEATVLVVDDAVLPDATQCLLGADLLSRQPIVIDWQRQEVRPFVPAVFAAPVVHEAATYLADVPVQTELMEDAMEDASDDAR